ISIMINNYNRARYLERTIRSIVEQNVGREVYEIVLVDNISSDHSLDVMNFMKEFYWDKANIRIFKRIGHKKEEPGNITKVRNFGIKQCRGEVIMFCDPELLHGPGTIKKMIEHHFQGKDNLYVVGKVYDAEREIQNLIDKTRTFEEALKIAVKNPVIRCGSERKVCYPFLSSVRKKWLVKVRGYDEEMIGGGHDDNDLWNRMHVANVDSLFDDSIIGIHQWHKPHWVNTDYNEKIMSSKKEILIRNNDRWGEIRAVKL
ncbi:hypothetical protein LCGC14_2537330, partial [marine sediment metagenome]